MFYYNVKDKVLFSREMYPELQSITENAASEDKSTIYFLNKLDPMKSRKFFCISDSWDIFQKSEGLELLQKKSSQSYELPKWLISKIHSGSVTSINTSFPSWQDVLDYSLPKKWRINVIGLGDVGGILVTGLRLLGGKSILSIGLYDRDINKVKRWAYEAGQIYGPSLEEVYPDVTPLDEADIFSCDMFVFCVSVGVPPLGSEVKDVRIAQFEGNSRVIGYYAKKAREAGYKGIFTVVSDPVDLLCKSAFLQSNTNENNLPDFCGLSPEQIRGYGLGVMNARAAFYAGREPELSHYFKEGRAFGPHGQGLVIADSIVRYNDILSLYLTEKTKNANLDIRAIGFKPYIAPALSSGALSIIAAITGEWHYSATYMGGIYMGSRNRLTKSGTELETLNIPDSLWKRLQITYEDLGKMI